jgi:hypothetical protein
VNGASKRRQILGTPSPATVIACIALAVALSGTGYAVTVLPRNSVGSAQLRANAVNSQKVKNGSLLGADFRAGQLPAGATGAQGERGPQGPPGEPNPNAVNSDRLDNLDSTDFLRSNAKAADADMLDGTDSSGFIRGGGRTDFPPSFYVTRGFSQTIFNGTLVNGGSMDLTCPTSTGSSVTVRASGTGPLSFFTDTGAADPTFTRITLGNSSTVMLANTDRVIFQFSGYQGTVILSVTNSSVDGYCTYSAISFRSY